MSVWVSVPQESSLSPPMSTLLMWSVKNFSAINMAKIMTATPIGKTAFAALDTAIFTAGTSMCMNALTIDFALASTNLPVLISEVPSMPTLRFDSAVILDSGGGITTCTFIVPSAGLGIMVKFSARAVVCKGAVRSADFTEAILADVFTCKRSDTSKSALKHRKSCCRGDSKSSLHWDADPSVSSKKLMSASTKTMLTERQLQLEEQ
mmetsp:Transcript_45598/g.120532  ORF Transcript_45598/g.120532 Transcript_45598/m.120532 type:complete len:207 (-) Transcript_45598:6-626(-)